MSIRMKLSVVFFFVMCLLALPCRAEDSRRILTELPVLQPPRLQINERTSHVSILAAESGHPSTLRDALVQAYDHNPTLLAAREAMKATHERLPQAFAGYKPTMGLDLSLTTTDLSGSNFGESGGATSKDANLSFNQPVYRGGRTSAQVEAARYVIRSQRESLRQTEQDIFLDVATAYLNVLQNQSLLELSEGNRVVIAKQREMTSARYDAGELTVTDVSQAQARLSQAEAGVITAAGDLSESKAVFEQLAGYTPGPLDWPSTQDFPLPGTLEDAQVRAENDHPMILSATYAHRAAEEDVDGVFGELLPEIGFTGSWNRTKDPQPGLIDEQTSKTVGLTASIPLYDAGGVRSRVRQAKHTANQRYLEILEVRRQVRQRAITAWEDLKTASAEIESRAAQVDAAKLASEGVHAEVALGQRPVLDALDADQELLDAQVALVSARRNEVLARISVLQSIGRLSPEIFGFNDHTADLDAHLKDIQWKIFGTDVDSVGESP